MQRFSEFQPTGLDSPRNYIAWDDSLDDKGNWFVSPCLISRDSGCLSQSNWEYCEATYDALNENQEQTETWDSYEIHRFGHWACGWYEIMLIRPYTKCHEMALEIEAYLEHYCILDESDFCEKEQEVHEENYQNYGERQLQEELCDYYDIDRDFSFQ
jgi:hypothetical protein